MRKLIAAALLGALASTASAQQSSVMATWLTASGKAQVPIGPCADPASGPIGGFTVGLINPKGSEGVVIAPEVATDYHNVGKPRLRCYVGSPMFGETQIWTRIN